jgi:uncharacterized protein YndB with AHSA1/START domain
MKNVENVEQKNALSRKEQLAVMTRIDAFDEAVIDSPAIAVFKAILDEHAGVTHWWMPYWESKPKGEPPFDHEGVIFDIAVHGKHTPRFSARITKIVEGKLIEMEDEGDFAGTGTWTFEPTEGKTKVRFRWNVKPKRLSFVLVSPFIDMGKIHSDVMQKGFKALKSYLSKK